MEATLYDFGNDGFVHDLAGFFSLLQDFPSDFPAADVHEGGEMRQREGLAAVLVRRHLCHDLGGHVAGSEEGVGLLDHGLADDRAILQHVLQIDEVAVVLTLGKVVRVMEMDDPLLVGLHDFLRQQQAAGEVLGHFAGHVVTLGGIDDRILVGIFLLHFFVIEIDEGEDPVIGGVALSGNLALVTIAHIFLRHFIAAHFHDARLHHVLDVFHIAGVGVRGHLSGNSICHRLDLVRAHLVDGLHFLIGLPDGIHNLGNIKGDLLSISLYNVHFHA